MGHLAAMALAIISARLGARHRHPGDMLDFEPGERVLLFAPHPDDETLGSGCTIQRAVSRGALMNVAFITNGDAFRWVRKGPRGYLRLGETRQAEALRATRRLGLSPSDSVFLGYPDKGLTRLILTHWDRPLVSRYTRVGAVPYQDAFRHGAPYEGRELFTDVCSLILRLRPHTIISPAPQDVHPDHRATFVIVSHALRQLKAAGVLAPRFLTYSIHYKGWRAPLDEYILRRPIRIPLRRWGFPWTYLEASPLEIIKKYLAMKEYHSQSRIMGRFFESFLGPRETFRHIDLEGLAMRLRHDPSQLTG